MNSEFHAEPSRPTDPDQTDSHAGPPADTYDEPRPLSVVTYTYLCDPADVPKYFSFDHDPARQLFIITYPNGTTELFRDNPVRYLVVEHDPQTGEMRPTARHGQPVYLHLSREQREG